MPYPDVDIDRISMLGVVAITFNQEMLFPRVFDQKIYKNILEFWIHPYFLEEFTQGQHISNQSLNDSRSL